MRIAVFLLASIASGERIAIYSEFRRVDAKGEIVAADAVGKPREILSPGFARNAWHTYRLVIYPPKNDWYTLHISQNPDNFLTYRLYKQLPGDKLVAAKLPLQGKSATGAPESYVLDVKVARDARVQRVRLEAQITDGKGWFIYPMEVRILNAQVPDIKPDGAVLPSPKESSDAAAKAALSEYLCEARPNMSAIGGSGLQSLIRRNALQDIALAKKLEETRTHETVIEAIKQAAGLPESFCTDARVESPYGPEWYLKVRDYLYREASR